MHQQYQALNAERQREHSRIAAWKDEKSQYEKLFNTFQRAMADNPFVMVLIDGDGMIVSGAGTSSACFHTDWRPVYRRVLT
jgi:hypothetical protein